MHDPVVAQFREKHTLQPRRQGLRALKNSALRSMPEDFTEKSKYLN